MRRPARPATRNIVSTVASVPAPTGGWNTRDNIANMQPTDAVVLDNWVPYTNQIVMRKGYQPVATGIVGNVETLMEYDNGSTMKLFAASGGKIYDASNVGPVGAPVATGYGSNRWQHVNFGTIGGQFIIAANGVDTPQQYNGTSWSNSTISGSGLTPSHLNNICVYMNRLYFAENQKLGFWYLPINAITGTVSYFDLAGYFTHGGSLQAIGTWSMDGGQGPQSYIAFITTKGEVLVYQGIDPGVAGSFVVVGKYRIGQPVGRRCIASYGGDLIVITIDGIYPLSKALITGRVTPEMAISDKISYSVQQAAALYGTNFGWQPMLYPKGTMLIFNVPIGEDVSSYQYVMSTVTGAWCRFTDIPAFCWQLYNENAYFGGAGAVYRFDIGNADDGDQIVADCVPAFNYMQAPGQNKHFKEVRAMFSASATVFPSIKLCTDFYIEQTDSTPIASGSSGSPWDISPWDTSPWNIGAAIRKNWASVTGVGFCGSLRVQAASQYQGISLASIDYIYESAQGTVI